MYKITIIDDEPLIQMGIHSLIRYKELSLVCCGFANTGNEALALIKRQQPDIVLLDIAMPDFNGIEIIEKIQREMGLDPVFIILTNHGEFSYVQSALRLGVLDFITKIEINEAYLNQTLQRAAARLSERRRQGENAGAQRLCDSQALLDQFFSKLLNNWFADQDDIDLESESKKLDIASPYYGSLYFRLDGEGREDDNTIQIALHASNLIGGCMKKWFPCYTSVWKADGIVCVIGLENGSQEARGRAGQAAAYTVQMLQRYLNRKVRVGIGSLCGGLSLVPGTFWESQQACADSAGSEPVNFYDGSRNQGLDLEQDFHLCDYRDALAGAFNAYDVQSTEAIFQDIIVKYVEPKPPLSMALSICFSLLHFTAAAFQSALLPDFFSDKVDPVESLREIKNAQQAKEWLESLRDAICAKLKEQMEHSRNWLVPSIMEYIQTHSGDTLSLNEVADIFEMSPGYLSSVFKKYGDISFSEYVRRAKIGRAKEMLAGGMKIHEVSDALGYSDPYYFSKLFKKAEGISPREFIIKARGN